MQNLTFVLPRLVFLMNFSFSFSEPRCGQGGLYSQLDKETVSVNPYIRMYIQGRQITKDTLT